MSSDSAAADPTHRDSGAVLLHAGVLAAAAAALLALPGAAAAQVSPEWDIPSFHLPDGEDGYGTYVTFPEDLEAVGALGTWRTSGEYVDLGLRAGIANVERPNQTDDEVGISAGLDLKNELVSAYEEFPLDVSWATGIGASAVPGLDRAAVRVPLGLVFGRRIEAEGLTVTPYLHPRLALDFLFREDSPGPGGAEDETDLRLDLDFGADFQFNDEWSIRVGFTMGRDFTAGAGLTF